MLQFIGLSILAGVVVVYYQFGMKKPTEKMMRKLAEEEIERLRKKHD